MVTDPMVVERMLVALMGMFVSFALGAAFVVAMWHQNVAQLHAQYAAERESARRLLERAWDKECEARCAMRAAQRALLDTQRALEVAQRREDAIRRFALRVPKGAQRNGDDIPDIMGHAREVAQMERAQAQATGFDVEFDDDAQVAQDGGAE